jgi:hypothetical protein
VAPQALGRPEPSSHTALTHASRVFHAALLDGSLEMGYASWNRVAIRFTPEGEVVEAVTSEPGGRALKIYALDGKIVEEDIPCRVLEERVASHSVST